MREKLLNLIYDSNPIAIDGESFCVDYGKLADFLIANGVTIVEDINVPCKERTLSFSIKEGMDLEGTTCSRVSVQYLYEGRVYGTYVDFKKANLDDDDIAEAFKELAHGYTMALECLEAEGHSIAK